MIWILVYQSVSSFTILLFFVLPQCQVLVVCIGIVGAGHKLVVMALLGSLLSFPEVCLDVTEFIHPLLLVRRRYYLAYVLPHLFLVLVEQVPYELRTDLV